MSKLGRRNTPRKRNETPAKEIEGFLDFLAELMATEIISQAGTNCGQHERDSVRERVKGNGRGKGNDKQAC